jgi:hypothetical protein
MQEPHLMKRGEHARILLCYRTHKGSGMYEMSILLIHPGETIATHFPSERTRGTLAA